MMLAIWRRVAAIAALVAAMGLLAVLGAGGASGARRPPPQHRQIAVAVLSNFRVALTAIRGPGNPPMATLVATAYQRSDHRWRPLGSRLIGHRDEWFWYSLETCSLTTTQYRGVKPLVRVESIRVSLLVTPSIGCSRPYAVNWAR